MAAMMAYMRTPRPDWLNAVRRYIVFAAVAHLVWEFAHVPLYTIWLTGTPGEILFAVVHCTGGDLLITLSTVMLALVLFGTASWPGVGARRVLVGTLIFGVGYTIFSEWLNIEVRQAWAYRDLMPIISVIDAGLTPVLQWLVIPAAGYLWAIRRLPWQTSAESANG